MPLDLVTAPTDEPVNVPELAEYLRITDEDTDENILRRLIVAARQQAEVFTNRAFMTQTWDWTLQNWWGSGKLMLPKAPLVSVSSVSYVDTNGVTQTWASSNYIVNTPAGDFAAKGSISLADGITFPNLESIADPVTIRFVAGYGTKHAVPEAIRIGLMMLAADMYEHRQSVVFGTSASFMPRTAESLLYPFRIIEF